MSRKSLVLSAVILCLGAGAAPAGPGMLDLIPRDAAGALAIRNITDLKKKADKLFADVYPNAPIGAAQVFEMMYQQLGIRAGLDEDAAAALVLANLKAAGFTEFPRGPEELLVLVLPFTDRDKMAANFGFKKGALQPGKMAEGKGAVFGKFFFVRDKYLFLGNNEKAVASVVRGKPLAGDLPEAHRKSLAGADLLVHVGPTSWKKEWRLALKELENGFGPDFLVGGEKDEKEVVRLFTRALANVRHGFLAVRLEGGLGVSFLAIFPKEGDAAATPFLKLLAGGGPSRLAGLPEGNVLAALAAGGDGTKNALLAKVFFNFLLRNTVEANKVITPADRPVFVGLFTEVWQRLKGSRVALYQNEAEGKHGLFSVVAVFDTEDAERFIADMRELTHIAAGTAVDFKTRTGRDPDGPKIEALVQGLADRRFRVRQSATTKLRLLGETALPFLDKAIKSEDVEVSLRARRLKQEIQQAAAQRRKELFAKDFPRVVKPMFAFVRRAETRLGCRVHVVTVKLTGKDTAAAAVFKELFGSDWDKIRLAVHGKQVVALMGSDVGLLDKTLINLQGDKAGLAKAKALAAFDRQRPASRKAEIHVSLQGVLALVLGPRGGQAAPARPGQALSSAALTLEKDLVQVDFRLASEDLKAMIREGNRLP